MWPEIRPYIMKSINSNSNTEQYHIWIENCKKSQNFATHKITLSSWDIEHNVWLTTKQEPGP